MSWIKDLNELSSGIKGFIVCVSSLMPFWFISFHLFNPVMFYHQPIYLTLAYCFCFSILWFCFNLIFKFLESIAFATQRGLKRENLEEEASMWDSGITAILFLCIPIVLCYFSKQKYDEANIPYHFLSFLKLLFLFLIVRGILGIIWMVRVVRKKYPQN